jgi:O-Antigen ligase
LIEPERLRGLAPFLPAGIVIVGWALLANFDGGYFPDAWYPSAIIAVCLLVATAIGTGRLIPDSRPARVALAALAGLVVWSFVSMAWSGSPGTGWASSNQLLLYLAVAWVMALLPWTPNAVRIALAGWVVAIVVVCIVSLVGAAEAGTIGDYFIEGRYLDPIGYSNGVSALPLMTFFPALWLCSRADAPIWDRAFFLAAAVFLAEFALLPQSRGAVIGFAVAILLFVALVPDRLRLIPPLLVVGGAVAVSVGTIFHVYTVGIELSEAVEAREHIPGLHLRPTLTDAVRVMAVTSVAALFLGAGLGLLDRSVRVGESAMTNLRRGVAAALGIVVFVGFVIAVANAGRISSDLSDRWDTFRSSKDTPAVTGARLTANYSDQRYDYWRVAYRQFERTPLVGAGAGSYEDIYTAQREFDKPSKYTHDIWLRFLAEGGLVAAALLAAYLAACAVGLAGSWRRMDGQARGIVAVCGSVLVYFLVHASFDWLDQFPALASAAFALPFLGIVMASGHQRPAAERKPAVRWAVAAGGCALAIACLGSLTLPYLADRHLDKGADIGLADVRTARKELDRAASLNPLSPAPQLLEGTILVAAGQPVAAKREFHDSLEVEDNWYAHYELALLESEAGRHRAALNQISQARSLDRHDPLLDQALLKIKDGQKIKAEEANSEIRRIQAERFTRPKT